MVFLQKERKNILFQTSQSFQYYDLFLRLITHFKYLGYQISCDLSDDLGIETRNIFVRTNVLARKFAKRSKEVKYFCLEHIAYFDMKMLFGVIAHAFCVC